MKKLLRPHQKKCHSPQLYVKPRLEVLEDRVNPAGQLLPINGQEHVFDDLRQVIYASNGTQIQRYDLATQQALPAWTIGASLKGLDITPDFQYLVVTDAAVAGTVYKVNLSTGNVDVALRYPVGGVGYDVVMVSNTRGFASFAGEYGNSITQFVEINLTTNTLNVRLDRGIDTGYYYMQRSVDRTKVLICTYLEGVPILYNTATDTFSQPMNAQHSISGYAKYSATNRDGSQFAAMVEDYQLAVFDDHFGGVENKWVWDGDYEPRAKITGIIFDPVLDRAYLGNTQLDKIDVYDTNSWKRLYSMPIGVNIHPYFDVGPFGYGSTSISGDGKYLVWSANGLRLFRLLDNAVAPAVSLKVDSFSERPMQGEQGTIKVSARNANGETAINYTGTIHFTSTDANAILPADYTFTAADKGQKEFVVRFSTEGNYTVTAVQVGTPAMSVTSPLFRVHAGLTVLPLIYSSDMVYDSVRNRVYFSGGWTTHDPNWDEGIIQRYDIATQTLLSPWVLNTNTSGNMEMSLDGQYLFVTGSGWNLVEAAILRIDINTGEEKLLWYDSARNATQLEALADGSILLVQPGYVDATQPTFLKITPDANQIVPAEYQMDRPPGYAVTNWIEVSPDRTTFIVRESRYIHSPYQTFIDGYSFHVGETTPYASQSFNNWFGRFPVSLSNNHVGFRGRYVAQGQYTNKLVDAGFQILQDPWPNIDFVSFAIADPVRDWFHTYSQVNGVYVDRIINIVDGSIVTDLPITTRWFASPGDYWFGEGQFMVTRDGSKLFVNTNATGNVTIIDLPAFDPTMASVGGGQGVEGNSGARTLDFVISLSEAKTTAQEVSYQTMDGTAIAGLDYQALSGSVIFQPGETQKTVSVTILSDNDYELDETVSLKLTQARGEIRIATGIATGTILNDDVPPMVQFVTSSAQKPEGIWSYSIAVQLAQASTVPATVSISLAGTATLNTDYLFPTTTLTFAPGETTKELTIYIDNDLLIEPGETVVVTLSNPVNATLGTSIFTYTILDDDLLPGIAFSTASSQGLESTTQINVPIQLTFPFVYDVVVKYSVIAGTAVAPFDYLLPAGQITFAPGETSKTIPLTIVNDGLAEVNETIAIVVEPFMYSERGDPWLHVYKILDDDTPAVLSFANASWTGSEGSSVDVVVQLSRPVTQPVTVNVVASGGTAFLGTDYQISLGQLIFAPGELSKTLQLTTTDDALYELTESAVLQLTQPINADLGVATFTANLTNNDPLPRVGFAVGASFGSEVNTATVLTLLLSESAGVPVTVNYQTTGGTATSGSDYTSPASSVTFAPGETSKTIALNIVNDSVTEPNETIPVRLTSALNAQLLGTLQHMYTIMDDETVRTLSFESGTSSRVEANEEMLIPVRLNSGSYQPITVNYAVTGGTATNGLDYELLAGTLTFQPGETVQFIPLSVRDDVFFESAETTIIKLSAPTNANLGTISTVTHIITNNDPVSVSFDLESNQGLESTTAPAIWVRLAAAATVTTKVNYSVTGGTATIGSDYSLMNGTLTFSPGQTAKKIPITIVNDTRDEDNETVRIQLSNPQGGIALGPVTAHTYTILDNDNPPVVSYSASASTHTEGNTAVSVTVKLSTASGKPVDVNYARTSGTATPETDFLFSEGTLRFNPGEVSKTFIVNILQDTLDEVDETIILALNFPVNATLGSGSTRTITIKDEDSAPKVGFTVASSSIIEGAGYVDLVVQLTAASGKQVSVKVGAGAGSTALLNTDYQPFATTLVFNPGETQKTVRINIVNDSVRESSKLLKVLLSAPVNATLGTLTTYQLTIQDDD